MVISKYVSYIICICDYFKYKINQLTMAGRIPGRW